MKLEISDRKKNVLFNREEIKFDIEEANATPSRKDVREKLAAMLNAKAELVIVGKINKLFGSKKVSGTAKLYSDEATLKKTELPQIIGRNIGQKKKGKKTEKAKAGKAAEAAPAPAKK